MSTDIVESLTQWVEAIRAPQNAELTLVDIALLNGECVSEDMEKAAAEITKLRVALTFYADPFAWKAVHDPEDAVRVPDFYSETDFGDTASRALGVIATDETGAA